MARKRSISFHLNINFVALALSIIAIVFCVANVDKRASADYDANSLDNSKANLDIKVSDLNISDKSEQPTLSNINHINTPKSANNASVGLDFSLKRLVVKSYDPDAIKTLGTDVRQMPHDYYVISFDTVEATREAYVELSTNDAIISVEPDLQLQSFGDPDSTSSWGIEHIGADHYMNWLELTGNTNTVKVAVIDSGINRAHDAFTDRLVLTSSTKNYLNGNQYPDDDNGHGTGVAGIITDSTPSNVKIYPYKVLNNEGKTVDGFDSVQSAIRAAIYDDGVNIINLSIGYDGIKCSDWPAYQDLFDEARSAGVLVVAAAGNSSREVAFPANCNNVIAVSSIKEDNTFSSSFSNYGPEIDFAMPGEGLTFPWIMETLDNPPATYDNTNIIAVGDGTSFASPMLVAAAALIKAENPSYSPDQLVNNLKSYSVSLGDSNLYGNGYVDFGAKKFNTPHIYAASSATDWAKTDTITVGAVSSSPITAVAFTLSSAAPSASDWQSGLPNDTFYIERTQTSVNKNGNYYVWAKTSTNTQNNALAEVKFIDNLSPNFVTAPSSANLTTNTADVSTSVLDSQSGLASSAISVRKKGSSDSYTKSPRSFQNTNTQTNITFNLSNLEENTEYEYFITATDRLGNASNSSVAYFTTTGSSSGNEQTPPNDDNQNSQNEPSSQKSGQNTQNDIEPTIDNTSTSEETTASAETTPETTKNSNNPVTVDPVIIYFSGFALSSILGFAVYRTIGGRRG